MAESLSRKLQERGIETIVVDRIPSHARHVIYIGMADEHIDADQLYDINHAAFAAARDVAAGMEKDGGMFWTVQSTGGDFGFGAQPGNQPGTAGLAALAKTAMKEWPLASLKAIDVDARVAPDVLADHICNELFRGGLEPEVGFTADGTRMTVGVKRSDPDAVHANPLAPHDTLLVSGGARGVTAQSLLALASRQPQRFILLGRSALSDPYPELGTGGESERELTQLLYERHKAEGTVPNPLELTKMARALAASREIGQTVNRLVQLGSDVCYVAADIADQPALRAALKPITEQWGAIRGIVHGAGVLADKRIIDKQDEAFQRVFSTKVNGFKSMLEVVNQDELKLVVIFSSVAAREGNAGQCDYAMANEVLNKMAHRLHVDSKRNRTNLVVKSLNWGPWDGGMVTPALRRHFLAQGIPLIPEAAGAALFADETTGSNPEEVEIVIGGHAGAASSWIAKRERTFTLEKTVDTAQAGWLDDHQIQGNRVVPIVMVREWFAQFARSVYRHLPLARLDDVKVLKGVRIPPEERTPLTLPIAGEERYDAVRGWVELEMYIADREGTRHYSARAVMVDDARQADERSLPPEAENRLPLAPWELAPENLYGDRLFHGPYFQAIERLVSVNAERAIGLLRLSTELPADERDAASDRFPVLLDGGLQLARLWGYETYGQPSLPMAIGSSFVASRQTAEEPVRCEVVVRRRLPQKFEVDIRWYDAQERCLAQMRQVEMIVVKERRTR
ncbi:MAG: SDR family NAD(P)-dependent oxidoreductase [Paenibacillaceae bacterium]|nr:SDR family NAD(P)-dependent oxidoreductase [Paenibacillaceae bacterium]